MDAGYGYYRIKEKVNAYMNDISIMSKNEEITSTAAIYILDRFNEIVKLCDEYEKAYYVEHETGYYEKGEVNAGMGYQSVRNKFDLLTTDISDMLKSGDIKSKPADYLRENFQRIADSCRDYLEFYSEEKGLKQSVESDGKTL